MHDHRVGSMTITATVVFWITNATSVPKATRGLEGEWRDSHFKLLELCSKGDNSVSPVNVSPTGTPRKRLGVITSMREQTLRWRKVGCV